MRAPIWKVNCLTSLKIMPPSIPVNSFDDQCLPRIANACECLACLDCGKPLNIAADRLVCPSCLQNWPLVDGIPHFVSEFPYWGEIPQKQMQEVNRLAQAGND